MSEPKHVEKNSSKSQHKSRREAKQLEKQRLKDQKKSNRSSLVSQNETETKIQDNNDEIEVGEIVPDLKVEI